MHRKRNRKIVYAPMYVHKFRFIKAYSYWEYDKYDLLIDNPNEIGSVAGKLRYYRLIKSLRQIDVAEYANINASTYISYEQGANYYPYQIMMKIAKCLEVNVDMLLDDYHKFIYFGQEESIKKIRKNLGGIRQDELAKKMGVGIHVIKAAEQGKVRFMRKNYEKLMLLSQERR